MYFIGSLTTLAFVVWLIGFAIHQMKGIEPGKWWCFVMMLCGGVMTVGNALGLLSGNLIAGLFLLFTVPATVQYYRMWDIKKRGW